ncbi:hypothetical protein HN51_046898, partial [Arachis hypogaea]
MDAVLVNWPDIGQGGKLPVGGAHPQHAGGVVAERESQVAARRGRGESRRKGRGTSRPVRLGRAARSPNAPAAPRGGRAAFLPACRRQPPTPGTSASDAPCIYACVGLSSSPPIH